MALNLEAYAFIGGTVVSREKQTVSTYADSNLDKGPKFWGGISLSG